MTDNKPSVSRRRLLAFLTGSFGVGAIAGGAGSLLWASESPRFLDFIARRKSEGLARLIESVFPAEGYATGVPFGDSIQRLIAAGALAPDKFKAVYEQRGGLPEWVEQILSAPSTEPIILSAANAPYLLNLLWPLGIANKTAFNLNSPMNGKNLPGYASMAGWFLGRIDNGAAYFNQVNAVTLDEAQEKQSLDIAENVYRPCCDNSTFYQDCNHGSAMLGLLQLAASQGMNTDDLYRLALVANSFWYPEKYLETALFFAKIEEKSWSELSPKVILGAKFSSISGWKKNVNDRLNKAGLLPRRGTGGSVGCGV